MYRGKTITVTCFGQATRPLRWAELKFKLYRQAPDKIGGFSAETAAFLDEGLGR